MSDKFTLDDLKKIRDMASLAIAEEEAKTVCRCAVAFGDVFHLTPDGDDVIFIHRNCNKRYER